MPVKKKKVKYSTVKKRLWKLVSEYVRRVAADDNGYVSCVTCGVKRQWNDSIDAGHFVPKSRGNVAYWMIENIHPQCKKCNLSEGGAHEYYTPYMVDMYGQMGVDEIIRECNTIKKYTINDLLEMEAEFKQKLNDL